MTYDVLVAGGGVAGIAAALAARRAGAERVLLIEREYLPGGLATAGLVTIYLPLCDGRGRQVSFGLAEELLKLSIRAGDEGKRPDAWLDGGTPDARAAQRYEVQFNPWLFAADAEQLLLREGVELRYGGTICAVTAENGRVTAAEAVYRSGRETYACRAVVDATGDANVFALAGAPTETFRQGNILAAWYYRTEDGENRLRILGAADVPDEYKTEAQRNDGRARFTGLDPAELSRVCMDARRHAAEDFLAAGGLTPGRRMTAVASIPQVRMTRRIAGEATPDDKDPYTERPDSIGLCADWRKRGFAWALPYGALCAPGWENLYAAGRCVSGTESMWDVTRVIPVCAVTGQAAGAAAAQSARDLEQKRAPLKTVQAELVRQGVKLRFADTARG